MGFKPAGLLGQLNRKPIRKQKIRLLELEWKRKGKRKIKTDLTNHACEVKDAHPFSSALLDCVIRPTGIKLPFPFPSLALHQFSCKFSPK